MNDPLLLGRIDAHQVPLLRVPQVPPGLLAGFRALGEASALVSDVLDEMGLEGAVASSDLQPRLAGARVVGTAITLRNEVEPGDAREKAVRNAAMGMHDIVAHNLASAGQMLVIQGVPDVSNLGGLSARVGKRQGEVGAIVDGGVRDVADFQALGYPVWSTSVTPVTGRWRIRTAQINAPVTIHGIAVAPGDIVVADGTGVVFVPFAHAAEVLLRCQRKSEWDLQRCAAIDQGATLQALFGKVTP